MKVRMKAGPLKGKTIEMATRQASQAIGEGRAEPANAAARERYAAAQLPREPTPPEVQTSAQGPASIELPAGLAEVTRPKPAVRAVRPKPPLRRRRRR